MNPIPVADIFLLNAFADLHPELHRTLYAAFEQAIPIGRRTGYFGKDAQAYIHYLKAIRQPEFLAMHNGGMNVIRREE